MAAISCDLSGRDSLIFKTVKYLSDVGVKELPSKYILPEARRPNANTAVSTPRQYDLPVIDISELEGPHRIQVVSVIGHACQQTIFFQVINHGVEESLMSEVMRVASEFFELPMEERNKFLSEDMMKSVRYGTSYSLGVFCWRYFLKHYCHPLDEMLPLWPSNPSDYRSVVSAYSKTLRWLCVKIMSAIVESLGLPNNKYIVENGYSDEGNQVMVLNYYPACPEPLPQPLPNSFIVNIGDQTEILSNGRYKSVVHRALVNSEKLRMSVATLMSMPIEAKIGPASELIDEHHPAVYRETNFVKFLDLLTSKCLRLTSMYDQAIGGPIIQNKGIPGLISLHGHDTPN